MALSIDWYRKIENNENFPPFFPNSVSMSEIDNSLFCEWLLLFWFRRLVWACLSVFYASLRFFFQLYCHFFPIEQCIKFESQSVRRNEVRKITAQIVIKKKWKVCLECVCNI